MYNFYELNVDRYTFCDKIVFVIKKEKVLKGLEVFVMRIISGKVRGLKLETPKNDDIRPTTDRIKESVFNIINSYILDSEVLDLFSGSGSLGLECISRGAKKCVFVDSNKESINLLKKNIRKTRFEENSEVFNLDFRDALGQFGTKNKKFDLIFLDPPYHEGLFEEALQKIQKNNLIKEDSLIIVEHDTEDKLPDKIDKLSKKDERKYGKTTITFYEKNI
ncbi:MAG: 16S rRNA (guanine(966)-N(2))-methyltransferase RsmD [Clostridioides sp.]|jgi:16S rRNA (guanine(966)-N(2))-methyltransferase RsmD|nr:16S rRNA (guanine(966)-N(2))-methyltransferase RsmD [Clostridioides sp.]